MSVNEILFSIIAYVMSMIFNMTIYKQTLKDLSKEDPWLGPVFTFCPFLNTLGTLGCLWVNTERKTSF